MLGLLPSNLTQYRYVGGSDAVVQGFHSHSFTIELHIPSSCSNINLGLKKIFCSLFPSQLDGGRFELLLRTSPPPSC